MFEILGSDSRRGAHFRTWPVFTHLSQYYHDPNEPEILISKCIGFYSARNHSTFLTQSTGLCIVVATQLGPLLEHISHPLLRSISESETIILEIEILEIHDMKGCKQYNILKFVLIVSQTGFFQDGSV